MKENTDLVKLRRDVLRMYAAGAAYLCGAGFSGGEMWWMLKTGHGMPGVLFAVAYGYCVFRGVRSVKNANEKLRILDVRQRAGQKVR